MHALAIVVMLACTTTIIANGAPLVPVAIAPPTDALRKILDSALTHPALGELSRGQSITHLVQRDPQRPGRLGRLGDTAKGFIDGLGPVSDRPTIVDTIQAQKEKRDHQPHDTLLLPGRPARTGMDDIPNLCTAASCPNLALPGHAEKRDPQRRGRLSRIGDAARGVADGMGALTDIVTIGVATQGHQA